MQDKEKSLLSRWREQFWPIERFELKKIVPLFFIKFFIAMVYGFVTTMKDASVVTAKGGGAEVIPVLKGWVVLPIFMLTALLYSKLTNIFKRSTLFYGIILFFMGFFFLYGFVLYPNLETLSPHDSADKLVAFLGQENSHWVSIYRNWVQSLFFVVAELWGQIAFFLLFWGFVNHICNLNEAKRSYNLFLAGGDLAMIFTGPIVIYFTQGHVGADFETSLRHIVLCIMCFGAAILAFHWKLTRSIAKDPRLFQPEHKDAQMEQKTKLSLKESIKFIYHSKPLRYIAIIVIAYGLTLNLIEVTWKANVKMVYPDTASYQTFMAGITSWVGVCTFFVSVFCTGILFRRLGWHFSAQLPPIFIGLSSLLFLFLFLFRDSLGAGSLLAIVLFGAFQNGISKIMKYTFFDQTKEIAFIPLDPESKVKGKAAIDVVGSRLGKSGAAWLQIILIQIAGTGSVLSITHFLIPVVACTVLFWILSVRSLNKQFSFSIDKQIEPAE